MGIFVAMIIAAAAMVESIWYRHKHRQELNEYEPTTKLLSGIGMVIAVAGVIVNEIGIRGGGFIFVIGMVISFAVCIPAMNKRRRDYYILLQEGRYSKKQLRCISPLRVWFGHAMGGMGLISKIPLFCTIIGIPVIKMIEGSSDTMDYIFEQQELREEAQNIQLKSMALDVNKEMRER